MINNDKHNEHSVNDKGGTQEKHDKHDKHTQQKT
jgi:hypothetical protein